MKGKCPLGAKCDKCNWNVHIRGKDPQSDQEIDKEACAIAWLPILILELNQMERQTAMSVESIRDHPAFQTIAVGLNRVANLEQRRQDMLIDGNR